MNVTGLGAGQEGVWDLWQVYMGVRELQAHIHLLQDKQEDPSQDLKIRVH